MRFNCNGGPGGGRRQEQDESYSEEEEEETSSTSVENSEDDEGEEEEEEESEEEEDTTSDDNDEDVEEDVARTTNRRPTRNAGPQQSSASSPSGNTPNAASTTQKGRFTRQKAREEMPTKRLLRSRKKSPVAGAGSKVPQVFKCPNCKKEFNNKVSLSRHTGWCKQKSTKGSSPRKRKAEEGEIKESAKKEIKIQNQSPQATQIDTASAPPSAPRGRGRPRKNAVPSTGSSPLTINLALKPPLQQQQPLLQSFYAEENMFCEREHVTSAEEFMQMKSPDSSPGVMDTSSEEDYEQKEFAANAHQLISHRNGGSISIDVVNPDPPPPPPPMNQSDGPVTCPQCKMTYRTRVGFQNHFPNCTAFSSDEEEEEGNEVDVVDEAPSFQQEGRPNWADYQTMPETVIAPPPPLSEPVIEESSEEESASSSDDGDGTVDAKKSLPSNITIQEINTPPPPPTLPSPLPPKKYQEISIVSGKSPIKIILPPDNTPQVINASGLTLERLEMSPIPRPVVINSPARTESPARKCATPQNQQESRTRTPTPHVSHLQPPPPTPAFHSVTVSHPTNSSTPAGPAQPPAASPYLSTVSQQRNINDQTRSTSTTTISSVLSTTPTTNVVPSASPATVSLSTPTLPPAVGNPPTYTQAQLMPGTVLHSTIMPVPVTQQMATSATEGFHHHPHHQLAPVPSQSLAQFPSSHFPLGYTGQAPSVVPHSTFRAHNGVPGIHSTPPGFPSTNHPGMFPGGGTSGIESHQIATMVQNQMLRHALPDQQRLQSPAQPQLSQLPQGISTIPGQPAVSQLPSGQQDQRGISGPGQMQQPYIFTSSSGSIGQFGVLANGNQLQPVTAFTVPPGGTPFPQQTSTPLPTNAIPFPPVHHQQPSQQLPHQSTGLNPQSVHFPPQQQTPGVGSLPTSLEGAQAQQFQAQSQLAHYSSYFQASSASAFPKHSVDNLGPSSQLPQVIQQQAVFSPHQIPAHPAGLPFPIQQQLQQQVSSSLQQHLSTLQQQQTSMFQQQQSIQNTNAVQVQTPAGATPSMPVFNIQQVTESSSGATIGSIPATHQPQQQLNPSMIPQASVNSNLQPGQVEFNLQQQLQLQQQQQQFLALQQQLQMQQTSDSNKPSSQAQLQPQQNMQPVMINGSLQWAKPGQSLQQIQVQMPQQQQQPQLSSSADVTTASLTTGQPQSTQPPQQTEPSAVIQPSSQSQPPTIPQVIQQFAQVTDSAGNTYLIMLPTQPQQQAVAQNGLTPAALGGSNAAQLLNLVPGLQGGSQSQHQQIQRINTASSSANCTAAANGVTIHSPCSSTSSSPGTFNSVGKSAPCPCASCKEKAGTVSALDKYKKVLPYPSPNDGHSSQLKTISPNIAPKQPISIRPALPKQTQPKVVRVQAATAARAPTLQLAFTHATASPIQNSASPQPQGSATQSQLKILPPQQQQVGLVGVVGANAPISSPNIAVVRPMENPLQRLSDQISQIESTFLTPPAAAPSPPQPQQIPPTTTTTTAIVSQGSPPLGHHITLVTASPPPPSSTLTLQIPVTSISPSQPISHHIITLDPPPCEDNAGRNSQMEREADATHLNIPMPRLTLVDHGIPPVTQPTSVSTSVSASSSPQLSSPGSSIQSISGPSTPVLNNNGGSTTSSTGGVKRKILQVSPSSGSGGSAAKSIRLTLHKMGGGDTYSIKKIEGDSAKANGSFKSLKIKGRILSSRLTTGPQEGTATNVVIVPCIRIVPNPDPDTNEGNVTIAEDGNTNGSGDDSNGQRVGDNNNNNGTNGSRSNLRLTHRAVIVYEGRMESNNKVLFQSSDVLDVWDRVFQIVQGTRLNHNLPPISYPATNIALPQNEMEAQAIFNKLGLTHRAIKFLLQKLPGLKALSQKNAKPPTPPPSPPLVAEDEPLPNSSLVSLPSSSLGEKDQRNQSDSMEEKEEVIETNESGSARLERFTGRKSFDMFGWLTSKHRDPLSECDRPLVVVKDQLEQALKFLSAPLGMRYRKMKEKWREYLVIKKSEIHGIGLFTKRDIEKGEMIIEYAGEVIRQLICESRERYYESKAIGCYMFRINDHVIDATMKGNAARFINHSCEPNCEAKTVKISGKDHIIIFSLRRIQRGTELTYDYQFEKEEEKIPCSCKSKHCRKYLN